MTLLYKDHPVRLGATYQSVNMDEDCLAILEEAYLSKDFFRLKCSDSPWIFECNYATFCYYWEIVDDKN
jgi:hypothetical protein